ncbi:bifunctional alpha/beta hydrolase/OsmC family protein [Amylibacter sp. SFDW26]|uniref:bifunctional alpha/beta hydrolase/OsmC family protein n=1 Tax=Amylibacter sp. SFDW26 TaxID=2652722 RepID=UPI00126200FC|nr:bifunctional alpha/beta hydrolase/OsmC family protein [Amylibacter sp. SFDW26]KAB7615700.1 bifunctional alpha/beta hydrolase/OsmC family protein [Amylibacter sp. SFDW26]
MSQGKITFTGHSGEELAARLDMPSGDVRATAIFAHCFTCTKDIPAARRIAQRLATMGIAVLRFDFTGLGHSGGEFANTDFTSNVGDLVHAAKYLSENNSAPTLLIGHSLGGAAVLKAAGEIPSIKAVVTIGAPADPGHVVHNFGSSLDEIRQKGKATVKLAGRPFKITQDFVNDVSEAELTPAIANLKRALLVLHSPTDQTVGIENAAQIFTNAKHPKSFITLDDADHLVTRKEDAEYAAEVIAAWSARYLGLKQPAAPIGAPEGVVRSTEADPDGFLQDICAGPLHHALADEPITYGGTNKGMSPYQFLSAGLGACTSMTVRMYARRKKIPLEHVQVSIVHHKVHAQDCDTCMTTEGRIDQFTREVRLKGNLTEEQKQKLLEIADKCPVHRTLEGEINVTTTLAD